MKNWIWVILIFFNSQLVLCQHEFSGGILPQINLNRSINKNWKINLKTEARLLLYEESFTAEYVLTDLSLIASRKIGFNGSLSGGYLFRYRSGTFFHRSIQQYALVQKYTSFRLSHRFAADQTFSELRAPSYRYRYRITIEVPLSGQSVNPGEFYFKAGNEYLTGFQQGIFSLEGRLTPNVGYLINDNNKLELGIDYRFDDFLPDFTGSSSVSWLTASWYLKI